MGLIWQLNHFIAYHPGSSTNYSSCLVCVVKKVGNITFVPVCCGKDEIDLLVLKDDMWPFYATKSIAKTIL